MIALSTAYKEALIAIDINGKQAFKNLDASCKHSENLLPSVDELLSKLDEKLANNDRYAVVIGPGSFTGLRIATALVKGFLAGVNEKNVIPITTFDLMAYSYIKKNQPSGDFVCVINALSGKYFVCKYNAKGQPISQPAIVEQDAYNEILQTKVSLEEEGFTGNVVRPTAEELLQVAQSKNKEENLIEASKLMPLYLRKSQAEDALEKK